MPSYSKVCMLTVIAKQKLSMPRYSKLFLIATAPFASLSSSQGTDFGTKKQSGVQSKIESVLEAGKASVVPNSKALSFCEKSGVKKFSAKESICPKYSDKGLFNMDTITERTEVSNHLTLFFLEDPITSTQEEAKKKVQHWSGDRKAVAVIAKQQTQGRGSNGRKWDGGEGNLFLTIGLPLESIPNLSPGLPFITAVFLARIIEEQVNRCHGNIVVASKTTIKWPNDVLINDRKVAGVLIEHFQPAGCSNSWMMVGIGVNVATTPVITGPGKHGRLATSLADWCPDSELRSAKSLGQDLAISLAGWTFGTLETGGNFTETTAIIEEWRRWVEFGKTYELRGSAVDEDQGGYEGETVTTVGINQSGKLEVRGDSGKIRHLDIELLH